MIRGVLAFLLLLLAPAGALRAAETLTSPDGRIVFTLDFDPDGRPLYSVKVAGKPVIGPSGLGFILADAPKLERNFMATGAMRSSTDTSWEQPWGERRFVTDRSNNMTVTLAEKTRDKRQIYLDVRVFNDGLGFRFRFPPAFGTVRIVEELTQFNIAGEGTAWWTPGGQWNRYEYLYEKTAVSGISQAHTPLTIRLDDGLHLALHEAALVNYPAMWLVRIDGRTLKSRLSPAAEGPAAVREAPFPTPWRVILIAPTAAGLYQASDVILNLNEPNAMGDVSWVKPHKYAGVWWEMHLDTASWGTGPRHGANNANVKRHIDFASANGFQSVLVEGWNIGWDGDWFANGQDFSFTKSTPDFDLPALAAYGKARGVAIMGHHETAADIATYEPQLAVALDLYAANGVGAVKTGYVADAGGVRARTADGRIVYEWHDGQRMTRHHQLVVEEAAKRKIAVNAHEPVKDTGLRRTWPNWVSREGARGMEYNAWGNPPNPASHEPTLVFTRMLAGPMDYTPGVVSLEGRGGMPIAGTVARQLALYLALYSPIQMVPDLPENYAKQPQALAFIRQVPTDWAETRMLDGEVGAYAVVARKDRNSATWYVGAINDDAARTLPVRLDFLPAGQKFRATIWKDGPGGPKDLKVETMDVTRDSRIEMQLAPGGGQVVALAPVA
jgi:alpha-glucosidase